MSRLSAIPAAKQYVEKYHPGCDAAVLAGSVVRGQETSTSDLDIVIFQENLPASYRESLTAFSWPIEVFVHNWTSYQQFFEQDKQRAMPSMPKMIAEGTIVKAHPQLEIVRLEAEELLQNGPDLWDDAVIRQKRYFLTDTADDFEGSAKPSESIFIASHLSELLSEFILRTNGQWIGKSKWLTRALNTYDKAYAEKFAAAFDHFYKTGEKAAVLQLVDEVLAPYGGRLFDGFQIGKKPFLSTGSDQK